MTDAEKAEYRTLFVELRKLWCEAKDATSDALAQRLGVRPQKISSWASGSDPTQIPTMGILRQMCDDLNLKIEITGSTMALVSKDKPPRKPKIQAAAS